MGYQWMGRYRRLVSAVIRYANVYSRVQGVKYEIAEGLHMTAQEWQILEYIIEHSNESKNMISIADSLCIPQSTFSKTVKMLCKLGLAEKYQSAQNRKNVILKPSEYAEQVYETHAKRMAEGNCGRFFEELEGVSDRDLEKMVRAIEHFCYAATEIEAEEKAEETLYKLD